MRKLFRSDTSIKVISVLVSILLWMYVVGVNNPTVSVVLKGIPVQISNSESFDSTGLKVISVSHKTIDVKIEGRHSEVSKVSAADVEASIDVSRITRAGTYDLNIVLNSSDTGVRYTNITSTRASIFTDYVIAVNKDILVETQGSPKENYAVESVATGDSKILVRGPKSVVDTVNKIVSYVDVTGADSDISKNFVLKVLDSKGKEINMTYITTNITETLVNVKFTHTKDLEINPVFVNSEMMSGYDIKVSPEKIKVVGSASKVKPLSIIDTEQIKIADAELPGEGDSLTINAALKLPDGVLIAADEPANVELVLTAKAR